jgi:hypothetical protein
MQQGAQSVPPQDELLHPLPVHSAELGRLPLPHFEITNPYMANNGLAYLSPEGQGMDGWSTPFAQQPDQDASIEKVLPSDFFSSVLDNTLGNYIALFVEANSNTPRCRRGGEPGMDLRACNGCPVSDVNFTDALLMLTQLDGLGSIHARRDPRYTATLKNDNTLNSIYVCTLLSIYNSPFVSKSSTIPVYLSIDFPMQ